MDYFQEFDTLDKVKLHFGIVNSGGNEADDMEFEEKHDDQKVV